MTGLSVSGVRPTQVTANWTPITYSWGSGDYQVFYSTVSGGPYTPFRHRDAGQDGHVAHRHRVGAPKPTPYLFVVQTTTEPHFSNQNTVLSGYSAEVPGMTTPVELMRFEIE